MKKAFYGGVFLIVCILIAAYVLSQSLPGGMFIYWRFDEGIGNTAYDSVGMNHVDISTTTWDSGQVDDALRFYGSYTGFIRLPDIGTQFGGTGVFSVEAWINPEHGHRHNYFFCLGDGVNPSRGLNIGYRLDTLCYRKVGGGQGIASTTIDLNEWHHIALTYDGAYAKVYQDGVEVIAVTDPNPINANPDLWIGWPDPYYIFTGRVDEYAVYDRLLTESEIQQHYQNGLIGFGYDTECTALPVGAISWWPMDEDMGSITDDIVDTNPGTLMNGAAFAQGLVGNAVHFDGLDDYVDVGNDPVFNFNNGTGDFTIDAWINVSTFSNIPCQLSSIVGKARTSPYSGYGFGVYTDGRLFFTGSGFWHIQSSPGKIPLNQWVHVAVTKSGSASHSYKLYRNGVLIVSATRAPDPYTYAYDGQLAIGRMYEFTAPGDMCGGDFHWFDGLIDEVEIYNRALSQSEIQAIYYAGSAGKCKVTNESPVALCSDIEIPADANCEASIAAEDVDGGSYDPDGDDITLSIDNIGPFPLGENWVTLTVTDENGSSGFCMAMVNVVDQTPPAPDNPSLPQVNGQCSAEVTTFPTATDNCAGSVVGTTTDPLLYTAQGTYEITWTYDDGNGNITTQPQTVVVQDTTPPSLQVTVSPEILWPPNHKMILVTPSFVVGDNCDPNPVVALKSIVMNEADTTLTFDPNFDAYIEEGHTQNDIQVDAAGNIYLRAERAGTSTNGRVYTITYKATDAAGNFTETSVIVVVPHNQ